MAAETEVKLRIDDSKAFLRKLKRLGAAIVGPGSGRVHEMNVLFDTAEGRLAKLGQLMRIRTETREPVKKGKAAKVEQRVLLTFKKPPEETAVTGPGENVLAAHGRYKTREEIELTVGDAGAMTKVCEGLGMRGWFRYEKYRTTYQLPPRQKWAKGLLIELDEVPIGTFVELEGPSEAIDRAAKELGYSARDFITKNYLVLYVEACRKRGEQPGDMLFRAKARK